MALFYTDKSRSFGIRTGVGEARELIVAEAIVAMTTAMLDNADDEVGLFWLPKGAVIVGATIAATDMDTGAAALAFDVGDATVENRIFAASTVAQTGAATVSTAMARTAFLFKCTTDTLIKAFVQTAAATAAAGTLYVAVHYFVDPEYSTTALTATTTAG
jgi:hypothetical protein